MNTNYKIIKSLSNNVVVSEKENGIYVLMGKGIGFGKSKGNFISEQSIIEQKFIRIDDSEKENYKEVLKNIDKKILEITEEIIILAINELGEDLNSHIHVGLADHINFSIRRMEEGIDIINPFLYDIKTMYPKEYDISEKALKMINDKLKVRLSESEIGFIALHIYSARVNETVSQSLKYTRIVKEVVQYIEVLLGIDISEKSLEYSRLISHLRYAIERIDKEKVLENILLPSVKKKLKKEFKIAKKVCDFITEKLGKEVPEDEVGYITLHINRLLCNIE